MTTTLNIFCATPTTLDSPEHIRIAEGLGYTRAWFYDTPQQSPDVWMMLARTAERTDRIGLGPGVLVPHLRHPMVNASATAALAALAPGRVAVGFGTGFSSRRAMGLAPLSWTYLEAYITAFTALLRGETVDWGGARLQMLHPDQCAPARPIDVPVLVAALGPIGHSVAKRLADGLFTVGAVPPRADEFSWVSHICFGTVLGDGEDGRSERVRSAAGPGTLVAYHNAYEYAIIDRLPGGEEWLAVVNRLARQDRHLAVHQLHLLGLNAADRAAWEAGAHTMIDSLSMTGTATRIRERIAALVERGVTELVYQPAGPNIPRELEQFMTAATV